MKIHHLIPLAFVLLSGLPCFAEDTKTFSHGSRPYFQLLFGYYAGWLTHRNNFDIGEAVFIHAWWDFWIIGAEFARSRGFTRDYNIQLPPIQFSF